MPPRKPPHDGRPGRSDSSSGGRAGGGKGAGRSFGKGPDRPRRAEGERPAAGERRGPDASDSSVSLRRSAAGSGKPGGSGKRPASGGARSGPGKAGGSDKRGGFGKPGGSDKRTGSGPSRAGSGPRREASAAADADGPRTGASSGRGRGDTGGSPRRSGPASSSGERDARGYSSRRDSERSSPRRDGDRPARRDGDRPGPRGESDRSPRRENAASGPRGGGDRAAPRSDGERGPRREGGKSDGRREGGKSDGRREGGKPGPRRDGDKPGPRRDGERSSPRRDGDRPASRRSADAGDGFGAGGNTGPRRESDRSGPRRESDRSGPRREGDKPGFRRESDKPGPRREGDKTSFRREGDRSGPRREGDKPGPRRGEGRDAPRDRKPARRDGPRRDDRAPLDARGAAVALLNAVTVEGRLLGDLTVGDGPLSGLDAPGRARAQRLAQDTLRGLGRLDAILAGHVERLPQPPALNVLRLGAYEICNGEAAHGVVNECVSLAAAGPRGATMKGLVNAVLRKVAETGPAAYPQMAVPQLPDWLRLPLVEAWGADAVTAMEAAHLAGAPLDLTPRDPADAPALAETLGATLLPTGSLRLENAGKISALPGHDEGRWWVQDAAAAMAARVLAPQPGETVLDLCAAPGGKTMQMAAAGADVTALDLSERRIERLRENLARTGLSATCIAADALDWEGGPFDAVLLDAPCSATGTIRRHPDLPHARNGEGISELIAQQAEMIDRALTLVAPGGRLVYATCSLIPDEGEVQVEQALERHPGLVVDRAAIDLPGIDPAWITEEGGLRLRPDHWPEAGGMDGFYIACLRRA